jgi:hypothetical protein
MKRLMDGGATCRQYLLFPAFMTLVIVILALTNSLWHEIGLHRHPWQHWFSVYLGMTFLVSAVALIVVPLIVTPLMRHSRRAASIVVGLITMIFLAMYAYWVGVRLTAQQADALLLRDLNYFFRELNSIIFIFVDTPIFGVLAALCYFIRKGKIGGPDGAQPTILANDRK